VTHASCVRVVPSRGIAATTLTLYRLFLIFSFSLCCVVRGCSISSRRETVGTCTPWVGFTLTHAPTHTQTHRHRTALLSCADLHHSFTPSLTHSTLHPSIHHIIIYPSILPFLLQCCSHHSSLTILAPIPIPFSQPLSLSQPQSQRPSILPLPIPTNDNEQPALPSCSLRIRIRIRAVTSLV